nr:protein CREG2 isoform X4 [Anas platyrhynchos]
MRTGFKRRSCGIRASPPQLSGEAPGAGGRPLRHVLGRAAAACSPATTPGASWPPPGKDNVVADLLKDPVASLTLPEADGNFCSFVLRAGSQTYAQDNPQLGHLNFQACKPRRKLEKSSEWQVEGAPTVTSSFCWVSNLQQLTKSQRSTKERGEEKHMLKFQTWTMNIPIRGAVRSIGRPSWFSSLSV